MIIRSLNYKEQTKETGQWQLKSVAFDDHINLIVGKNTSGKSRLTRVLMHLAKILTGHKLMTSTGNSILPNGNWQVEFFKPESKELYFYQLEIVDNIVIQENLKSNDKPLIKRDIKSCKLISFLNSGKKEFRSVKPPADALLIHVRRDETEHPFLEDLFYWAQNVQTFLFNERATNVSFSMNFEEITKHNFAKINIDSLGKAGTLLYALLKYKPHIANKIIKSINDIGYKMITPAVEELIAPVTDNTGNKTAKTYMLNFTESGLTAALKQRLMSEGLYRVISTVIIIEYCLAVKKTPSTIVIDDFAEGVDYDHSTKLLEWLLRRLKNKPIQVICTTNSKYVANMIPLTYWNVFIRDGETVQAFNIQNSKDKFERFSDLGLNNFDLLTSSFLV